MVATVRSGWNCSAALDDAGLATITWLWHRCLPRCAAPSFFDRLVGVPRLVLVAFLLAIPLGAAPSGTRITLLDLRPSFLKPGNQTLLRNGTRRKPGLFIAAKRYRGLNAPLPSRVGFDLELSFTRFSVKVGLLDGSHKSAQAVFRVLGDGKVLAATPPLFPGQAPVELVADVSNVFLLELVCKKIGRGHANVAWIGVEVPPPRERCDRCRGARVAAGAAGVG